MASIIKADTLQSTTANVFVLNSSGTEYARFDSTGVFQLTNPTTFPAGTVSLPSITATGDTNTGLYFPAADTIAFTEGGVESMRIDSSGNVGIGTSSPGSLLHLRSALPRIQMVDSDNSGTAYIQASDGNLLFYADDSAAVAGSNIMFAVDGSERARIDSSGNVLIGGTSTTTHPALNKFVSLQSQTNNDVVGYGLYVNEGINSRRGSLFLDDSTGLFGLDVSAGSGVPNIVFRTAGTEHVRITSGDGNLLVGTTSTTPNPGIAFQPVGNITVGNSAASTGFEFHTFRRSATQIGSITQNGTTAVAYNTSSDYRLKENIVPMTGALATVSALKPVTYKWKADGSDGQGFIAHELQAVVPDCVTGEKDGIDSDGNPKYQGIDTSFLVATLTAALQEQQALIIQLQADVAALKAK